MKHAPVLAVLLAAAAFAVVDLAAAEPAEPVATATLVAGSAWRVDASGREALLAEGDALREGDRIRTGPDGLVQLAFVDAARLSLRPDSEVVLAEYRTAAGSSAMRLELERGVVRQISGEAAKRSPQSYRLNTPIAAIGVRGTDFLVRTDPQSTRAFVQEGAIVLAPIGPGCPARALGACDDGRLIGVGEGIWEVTRDGSLLTTPVEPDRLERVFGTEREVSAAPPGPAGQSAPETQSAPVADGGDASVDAGVPSAADPAVEVRALNAVDVSSPQVTSLAWGRWTDTRRLPETLSIPYHAVRVGRDVTVGNPSYALWRDEGDALDPGLGGQVDLRLAGGAAALATPTGMREARLGSGLLRLDFDARRFETALDTTVPGLGAFPVEAAGAINPNGIFVSVTPDTHVAGALNADGSEAGYFFERHFSEGLLEGITLWGR